MQQRLSSITCCDSGPIHFYTYLMGGQQTFKADDDHVRTAGGHCKEDIYGRGFVYIYEKQTPNVTASPPLQSSHAGFRGQTKQLKDLAANQTRTYFEAGGIIVKETENVSSYQKQQKRKYMGTIFGNIFWFLFFMLSLGYYLLWWYFKFFCLYSFCGLYYLLGSSSQALTAQL